MGGVFGGVCVLPAEARVEVQTSALGALQRGDGKGLWWRVWWRLRTAYCSSSQSGVKQKKGSLQWGDGVGHGRVFGGVLRNARN